MPLLALIIIYFNAGGEPGLCCSACSIGKDDIERSKRTKSSCYLGCAALSVGVGLNFCRGLEQQEYIKVSEQNSFLQMFSSPIYCTTSCILEPQRNIFLFLHYETWLLILSFLYSEDFYVRKGNHSKKKKRRKSPKKTALCIRPSCASQQWYKSFGSE